MKYRNFRIVGRIFQILAWLNGLITVGYFLLVAYFAEGALVTVLWVGAGIIVGLLTFAFLYALSQFIYVILDIEQHTRATRAALTKKEE